MKKLRARVRQGYYFLCYQYARFITNLLAYWKKYISHIPFPYCFMWGRRESPEPIKCECGWAGMIKWLKHDYEYDGFDDVEPVDKCPRCRGYL